MTKAPFLDMAFDEWRKIFTVMSMVHFYARKLLPARW